jgi:hypothetical protein
MSEEVTGTHATCIDFVAQKLCDQLCICNNSCDESDARQKLPKQGVQRKLNIKKDIFIKWMKTSDVHKYCPQ